MNVSKSGGEMPPVHPGEVLREDFMKPLGLAVNRLAPVPDDFNTMGSSEIARMFQGEE
jgi:hypothetical protein